MDQAGEDRASRRTCLVRWWLSLPHVEHRGRHERPSWKSRISWPPGTASPWIGPRCIAGRPGPAFAPVTVAARSVTTHEPSAWATQVRREGCRGARASRRRIGPRLRAAPRVAHGRAMEGRCAGVARRAVASAVRLSSTPPRHEPGAAARPVQDPGEERPSVPDRSARRCEGSPRSAGGAWCSSTTVWPERATRSRGRTVRALRSVQSPARGARGGRGDRSARSAPSGSGPARQAEVRDDVRRRLRDACRSRPARAPRPWMRRPRSSSPAAPSTGSGRTGSSCWRS